MKAQEYGGRLQRFGTSKSKMVIWCSSPSSLAPGESDIVECLVVIPDDEPAGSEPTISLIMEGDGIEIRDTKSLLVEDAPRLSWNLIRSPLPMKDTNQHTGSMLLILETRISHTLTWMPLNHGMLGQPME